MNFNASNDDPMLPDEEHLAEKQLAAMAERPASEWPDHIHNCSLCGDIVRLLQNKAPSERNLAAFLSMVEARAKEVERDYQPSFWNRLGAAFSFNGLRWSTAAAVPILLLMVGSWVWFIKSPSEQKPLTMAAKFEEDKREIEVRELHAISARLSAGESLSGQEVKQEMMTFTKKVDSLKKEDLTEKQREEVDGLTGQVAAQLELRKHEIHRQTNHRDNLNPTPDSDLIPSGDLQRAWGLFAKTTGRDASFPGRWTLVNQRDVQSAVGQFKFRYIGSNIIVLQDLKPDRDEGEKEKLFQGLKGFSTENKVTVILEAEKEKTIFKPGQAPLTEPSAKPGAVMAAKPDSEIKKEP
jgi:hypothetical protein